jgi:predicted SAM-dependent methyltransferase
MLPIVRGQPHYGYDPTNHPLCRWSGAGGLVTDVHYTTPESRDALEHYLATCHDGQEGVLQTPPAKSRTRRVVKALLPPRVMEPARVAATDTVNVIRRSRNRRVLEQRPLQLHLGSGKEHKANWVNVDLLGDPVDLAWNLARPLPLPDDSVDAIFHEHLLEHLPLDKGIAFLRECDRVLKPDGVIRIGVPDAGALIDSYREDPDGLLGQLRPDRPTPMLALQEFFYWYRHRCMYDLQTLLMVGASAGFTRLVPRSAGESSIDPCPDTDARRLVTLYVEGR